MKQNQQYELGRLVVQTLQGDANKQKVLTQHGFERKRTQEGQAILNKIDQLSDERQKQDGAKLQATKTLSQTRKEAHRLYIKHVSLSRLAFDGQVEQQRLLGIDAPREESLAGWLKQATNFYRSAPDVIDELSQVGITLEALQQGEALVQAVAQTRVTQMSLMSDTQRLSKQRKAAFMELNNWLKDFRYVARYAFREDSQQLEAFGMVVA